MTDPSDIDTFADGLVALLIPLDAEPWHLRPPDSEDPTDTTATIQLGQHSARVCGRLDGAGYSVRQSDIPIREGFAAVLEVDQP